MKVKLLGSSNGYRTGRAVSARTNDYSRNSNTLNIDPKFKYNSRIKLIM